VLFREVADHIRIRVDMSDHWETFPCAMGDHVAFISYDHGIRRELEKLPFPYFARYEVTIKNPDDRGLPVGDEFSRLNEFEDQLAREISEAQGVQVGRITTNGRRYFHYYTSHDEASAALISQRMAANHDYVASLSHSLDLDRSHYWNELFPTSDDWQVIQDMRVEESLRKEGDPLVEPREIEHWAYFKTEAERERFVASVQERFTAVELYESPESDRGVFTAKLRHTGLPDYRSMNKFTLLLSRAAQENGGDYDGWETQVCRS
jgi:hypothetical protein